MSDNKEMLGTAPIGKLLFKLAVPTVVAQLINMLYNIVDRIYIGHMPGDGSLALTGVGVCMPIIMIISAFAALIASGGAPKASISMGKGDNDSAEKILGGCFSLQIIISAVLTTVLLIWNKDLLLMFGASQNNTDKFTAKEVEKYSLMDKKFDAAWRDKVTRMHFRTYYMKTKGAWILRFDDILSSALELGKLKNNDFELPEETKARIANFTTAPSTAYALETLIKYYYVNQQEDTDWVVLPVANFDAYFGSTSFSKKRLTELVKSGAIERENSYNVSRYRLNDVLECETSF